MRMRDRAHLKLLRIRFHAGTDVLLEEFQYLARIGVAAGNLFRE